MRRKIAIRDGRLLDLSYFVEWRPYLWARPVSRALRFLGDLAGQRVLEIGGRSGRMSSLFALLGAEVTMLEKGSTERARAEAAKWGVADRIRLISTDNGWPQVRGETFDVVFTKSVLWSIADLDAFIAQIDRHLAAKGRAVFLENVRGGRFVSWLRDSVVHRGRASWLPEYHGITTEHLDLFRRRFDRIQIRRHCWFVYEIAGYKQPVR